MDAKTFRESLSRDDPPQGLSPALTGLWWEGKGAWARAHECVQSDEGPEGAWVHAYLHRKEGDSSNAGYWYRRAGKSPAQGSLEEEWKQIVDALLGVIP